MSLSIKQEPKYDIVDGKIVNRATGIAIPDNEPVIIIRAKDKKAKYALEAYLDSCNDPAHRATIKRRMAAFSDFAAENPGVMKEPDTASPVVEMFDVVSSNVAQVGYHAESQTLAVTYKHGERPTWHYLNVPPHVNEARLQAGSIGSFIASNVKSIYDAVQPDQQPQPATA